MLLKMQHWTLHKLQSLPLCLALYLDLYSQLLDYTVFDQAMGVVYFTIPLKLLLPLQSFNMISFLGEISFDFNTPQSQMRH